MSGKYLLDTNIFVYSFDRAAKAKRARARELIDAALRAQKGIISTQVLQEFLNAASKKFEKSLSMQDCYRYLDSVLAPLCEVFPSIALYRNALELQADTRYSFYDCLIIAAALHADCDTLYSEDLRDGHNVRGLTIKNPFLHSV